MRIEDKKIIIIYAVIGFTMGFLITLLILWRI